MNKINQAFTSLNQELNLNELIVTGKIPAWLNGRFITIGPAQFELGDTTFNHWFDGFSMLYNFTFSAGKVQFVNRFLRSMQYQKSMQNNALYFDEFATLSKLGFLRKIKKLFNGELFSDNCNVNTLRLSNKFFATSDVAQYVEFDADTLATKGNFKFQDALPPTIITSAHPHYDYQTREVINFQTGMTGSNYIIYRIPEGSLQREIIAQYRPKTPFYMHSFCVTPNYIILLETPFKIKFLAGMLPGVKPVDLLYEKKGEGTTFVVINRKNGAMTFFEAEKFFYTHTVNAYEAGGKIFLDVVTYGELNIYENFYLEKLRQGRNSQADSKLIRYQLNLADKKVLREELYKENIEFPTIHYQAKNGMNYQLVYAINANCVNNEMDNAIIQFNNTTNQTIAWREQLCQPGEPLFIPKDSNSQLEEGVVLSVVYDDKKQVSFLLILNAQDLAEQARIYLPCHIPFPLHGNFYPF